MLLAARRQRRARLVVEHCRFVVRERAHCAHRRRHSRAAAAAAAGQLVDAHPAVITRCILDLFMHFFITEVMLETSLAEQIGLSDDAMAGQMAEVLLHGILRRP